MADLSPTVPYSISGSARTDTTTLIPSLVAVERAIMLFFPRKLRTRSGLSSFQILRSFSYLFFRFAALPACSSLRSAEKTLLIPPFSPPSRSTHTGFSSRSATWTALGAPAGTRFHAACFTSYSFAARYVVTRVTL